MPGTKQFFTVTEDHLKLLQRMYVGWQDCEYGAPEIDPKRPYGNSDVEADIAEILGWGDGKEYPYDELDSDTRQMASILHEETQTALQILLTNLTIEPGDYVADPYSTEWRRSDQN